MNTAGQMNTAAGMVIGTAAYMSPEQVRGQLIDHRSDLFSFGAVLYQMLTGNHAFSRDSAIETMNAILKEDSAEIDTAQMKVSPGLERIVRHSLEKNPADRFQSARDLGFALGALTGRMLPLRSARRRFPTGAPGRCGWQERWRSLPWPRWCLCSNSLNPRRTPPIRDSRARRSELPGAFRRWLPACVDRSG